MDVFALLTLSGWFYVIAVLLFAYVLKGMAGFGSGLVAVPLLAIILPLSVVVPVLGVISYSGTVMQSIQLRKNVSWKDCFIVLPFSLAGIIVAIWVFQTASDIWLTKALAFFIIAYALFSYFSKTQTIRNRRWAMPIGFFGGFVGALFGTGGPFYVFYLKLRQLDKSVFRATIVLIFLFDGAFRISAYTFSGFYNAQTLLIVLCGFPVLFLGLYIGNHLHLKITNQQFSHIINSLLLLSGLILLFK